METAERYSCCRAAQDSSESEEMDEREGDPTECNGENSEDEDSQVDVEVEVSVCSAM